MMMCLKKKQRPGSKSLAGSNAQVTNSVEVTVTLGNYPEEVSWCIKQGTTTIYEVPMGAYAGLAYGAVDKETVPIAPGNYTLELIDSFGDGWNGATITIMDGTKVVVPNLTLPAGSYASVPFTVSGVTCTPTQVPNSNKSIAGSITGTDGDIVAVTCNPGYDGSGNAVCQTNGVFTVPTCVARPCAATQVANSDKALTGAIRGTTGQAVPVVCNAGYSGGGNAVCGATGFFRTPTCTANPCAATQVPNSNKATAGSITGTTGQTVAVTCNDGYSGSGNAVCQTNGTFAVPTCAAKPCLATQVANSNKAALGSVAGTTTQVIPITCNPGYTGGGNAVCQPSGRFTLPTTGCTGNVSIDVTITLGKYPEDIGWNIKLGCNTIVSVPTGTYAGELANAVKKQTLTKLAPGTYTLELLDAYGDGWNDATIQINQGVISILPATTFTTGSLFTTTFTVAPVNSCTPAQVPNSDKAVAGSITGIIGQSVYVTCNTGYTGSGNAVCGANGAFTLPTCTQVQGAVPGGIWSWSNGAGNLQITKISATTVSGVYLYAPSVTFTGTISGNTFTMNRSDGMTFNATISADGKAMDFGGGLILNWQYA